MDAENMKAAYEKQAAEKYSLGKYKLGKLDKYGQRITIIVELERRVGNQDNPLHFDTGWLVYPNGKILNTTPATNLSSK